MNSTTATINLSFDNIRKFYQYLLDNMINNPQQKSLYEKIAEDYMAFLSNELPISKKNMLITRFRIFEKLGNEAEDKDLSILINLILEDIKRDGLYSKPHLEADRERLLNMLRNDKQCSLENRKINLPVSYKTGIRNFELDTQEKKINVMHNKMHNVNKTMTDIVTHQIDRDYTKALEKIEEGLERTQKEEVKDQENYSMFLQMRASTMITRGMNYLRFNILIVPVNYSISQFNLPNTSIVLKNITDHQSKQRKLIIYLIREKELYKETVVPFTDTQFQGFDNLSHPEEFSLNSHTELFIKLIPADIYLEIISAAKADLVAAKIVLGQMTKKDIATELLWTTAVDHLSRTLILLAEIEQKTGNYTNAQTCSQSAIEILKTLYPETYEQNAYYMSIVKSLEITQGMLAKGSHSASSHASPTSTFSNSTFFNGNGKEEVTKTKYSIYLLKDQCLLHLLPNNLARSYIVFPDQTTETLYSYVTNKYESGDLSSSTLRCFKKNSDTASFLNLFNRMLVIDTFSTLNSLMQLLKEDERATLLYTWIDKDKLKSIITNGRELKTIGMSLAPSDKLSFREYFLDTLSNEEANLYGQDDLLLKNLNGKRKLNADEELDTTNTPDLNGKRSK